ncbi:condensin complex subunit 2-like [Varroa jacobsoni]|uniref:condensin complex subunit 2-like n=1 Tax=Varroa jacobsoni TaxID=62625 RepID=UPI000BFA9D0E|nr:condensin complex subunit 2-like [Varroa jacobsoni]XP_022700780.1 condensin complex subunit 2-like [Varroa jacobsoni]XP_022700781.1 condensin complex subunit 2-like [Varroa jacobsoni]
MLRRKRLSLAPDSLADLREISAEELQGTRVARALELQQKTEERQNEMDKQTPNLEGDQLSAYIQSCVKLSQDNKITIRNAFDVQLIDYMISFAKEEKDGNATNFSLASMTLDASGKIYGYRVDAVHQDVFRLVSGIGVGKNIVNDGGIPAAPEELDQDRNDQTKKAKKRRLRSTYIGEENAHIGNIEIDYEISGNDILTTVHHNDGNALGRIMSYNLVPMETDSVDIEGSNAWWQANGSVQYVPCVADNLPTIAERLPLSTYLLEQNMEATFAVETSCPLPNHPSQGDYNNLNESVVFDPDAEPLPVAEDVHDSHMDIAPNMSTIMERNNFGEVTTLNQTAIFAFDFLEQLKSQGLNFAGPTQFKLRRFNILGHEKKNPGGTQAQKNRSKRNLDYVMFNDDSCVDFFEDAQPNLPKTKGRAPARSATTLASLTMDRWTSDSTTLTVEFTPSSFERLTQLFELSNISVHQNKQKPAEDFGEGRLIEYRDDADDRPVSPCADDHFSDLGRDVEHADRDFNIENVEAVDNDFNVPYSQPAEDELGYDNLISAPGVVAEKLVIAYTKAAKKFNVRQMKESYWKVLTNSMDKAEAMDGEKSFSQLFDDVQPHLSQMNRKNVSLPLAFVSMLLLCNEKHLMLKSENEYDFKVYQAPNPYK